MSPETRSAPRRTAVGPASGHLSVTRRGDVVVRVPATLVRLLAIVGVLSAIASLPMAAVAVIPTASALPLGPFAVGALLAAPILVPLAIVGLLAWLLE